MNAVKFIPIKYHKRDYPKFIKPIIQEIAGHFDVEAIHPLMNYLLHTEYSAYGRKLDSLLLKNLDSIKESHKNGIPQLWFDEQWSLDFFKFIKIIIGENKNPNAIEIHPPFNDYCISIKDFIDKYKLFEESIINTYPETDIVIENRCGSGYTWGKFLVSKTNDLIELCRLIEKNNLKLRIVLDLPQLFSSYGLTIGTFSEKRITEIIESLNPVKNYISGIHMWGKKKSSDGKITSHIGNLDTYFEKESIKNIFLEQIFSLLDDGKVRYFVPEVNSSNEDVAAIVKDFISHNFTFVK